MPITSTFTQGLPQKDGRIYVHETHTDDYGRKYSYTWLGSVGDNVSAKLAAHATALANQLRDAEIDNNVAEIKFKGSLATYSLEYSTVTQNFVAVREAYKQSSQYEAIMIGDFFASLTDTQLRNLFSYTQAQVDALRTNKLTPAANAAATIRATTGVA